MFRSRFSDVFPKSLPHYGPQDIEQGVQDTIPGEHVERLLCALIGLVLNRKKDVEYGFSSPGLNYFRALSDLAQFEAGRKKTNWMLIQQERTLSKSPRRGCTDT